ncbi:PREDICTED: uncharacterized protein LOC105456698 [Wasmannia auropunctata]|uniref:uncharacterized protein LOC105456698 n=1 Tax=Wasmannia auropunctata TaxID=64793 RepID=UPI0005EF248D|nr:PREDICTED: uncharacterized protein LOC105456698 [Wasmannia auropunctata]
MGKDTKRKNKAKAIYKKIYSQKNVNDALKEIEKGMSTRKAADAFQVPRSTLYAKQKRIIPVEGVRGPNTYLTAEEEKLLVDWIFYCSERGFPVSKSQLLQCVQKLITELERKIPFKDNKSGRHWWESFCHRHPDVTPRIAQNLTMNRASTTEDVLKNWFNEVKKHLEKLNLLYIHPSRVFNLDESAFFLIPKADSVLARKGSLFIKLYMVIRKKTNPNKSPPLRPSIFPNPGRNNGFQTCGLSPFSSDAVDFNVFNKKKKKIAESTECVDQDLTDSNEQEEATKHLKYFEHRLSSDDLQDFKNALSSGSLKIFNSANEGLFKYWLDMKRLSGENVSNNVSTNEKDSRVDKSEMSIEVVNSASCPVVSDMNVDISQLEIVFLSEENENILIPETETLSTARGDVNTSKICDPTCRADIEPFEDLGQHDFSEVDKNVENKMKCDTKKLEDSNFNEQILNVTAIESNVTVHEKIINEVESNEKVLEELKENLNYNKPVFNISAIEELKNNNDQANDKTHQGMYKRLTSQYF